MYVYPSIGAVSPSILSPFSFSSGNSEEVVSVRVRVEVQLQRRLDLPSLQLVPINSLHITNGSSHDLEERVLLQLRHASHLREGGRLRS